MNISIHACAAERVRRGRIGEIEEDQASSAILISEPVAH